MNKADLKSAWDRAIPEWDGNVADIESHLNRFVEIVLEGKVQVPRETLIHWREEWLAENDPKDGTDCVTPFDEYLYRG